MGPERPEAGQMFTLHLKLDKQEAHGQQEGVRTEELSADEGSAASDDHASTQRFGFRVTSADQPKMRLDLYG